MWIESDNRVYGRTRNAYDPHRTAGGSSGGEGAAVGSGGSPIGLGSDIGGSIRAARVLQRRVRPQAVARPRPQHRPVPQHRGRGRVHAHARPARPPRRGPDAGDCGSSPGPTAATSTASRASSATRPPSTSRRCACSSPTTPRLVPARKELRDARDRAADALRQRRRRVRDASRSSSCAARSSSTSPRSATAPASRSASCSTDAGVRARGARHWVDAVRGRGDHTLADPASRCALERLNRHMPDAPHPKARRGRPLAARGGAGDPRRRRRSCSTRRTRASPRATARTVGRAWVITPAAVFNLLGLPVTQVPLGLNREGPAARRPGRRRRRQRPPDDRRRARARAALRRLGPARLSGGILCLRRAWASSRRPSSRSTARGDG